MSVRYSISFIVLVIFQQGDLNASDISSEDDDASSSTKEEMPLQPAIFHWPQGIVNFYVDPGSYDDIIDKRINSAMNIIQQVSCVVFRQSLKKPEPFDVQQTWLMITNPQNVRECVHETYIAGGGMAIMTLGYDCMSQRDIIHALMHVLGFRDEVTNPQRDLYVRVQWNNIQMKYRSLFRIQTEELPYKANVEYDPQSVMHFHDRAYSANGAATIIPLMHGLQINPSDRLSQLDIMKLRLVFGHECNKRKVDHLLETCQNALLSSESDSNAKSKDDSERIEGLRKAKNETRKLGKTK